MSKNGKRVWAVLLVAALLAGMLCVPALAAEFGQEWEGSGSETTQMYSDVPVTHWAYNAIARTTEKGWFAGYSDGTFHPNDQIDRSQAVVVFVRFLGLPLNEYVGTAYHDIDGTEWYAPYIQAGSDLMPIHTATGTGAFQANMPITREDVIYALLKSLGYSSQVSMVDESVLAMYADQTSISVDMRPYVAYAVGTLGLISGKIDGGKTYIGAQDPLTRAEFATMLYRATNTGVGPDGLFTGNPVPQSVTVSPQGPCSLELGQSVSFTAQVNYTDGTTGAYAAGLLPYNASENDVVTISEDGVVTAAAPGTCEIKFANPSMEEVSVSVEVMAVPITAITVAPTADQMLVPSEGFTLTATALYADGTTAGFEELEAYDATGTGVVAIEGDKVTALKVGTCQIRFRDEKAADQAIQVTVVRGSVSPTVEFGLHDVPTATNADSYTFTGTVPVTQKDKVALTCNGEPITPNEKGWFTFTAALAMGENTFTFLATDQTGRFHTSTVTLIRR